MFPALDERLQALNPEEPYRRALSFVRERVRATAANADGRATRDAAELLEDLRTDRAVAAGDAGDYYSGSTAICTT